MEYLEIEAKTVDEAITEALVQLGVTSDQLEYEVIEKGSSGFLGINSKMAKIKARRKFAPEDEIRSFLQKVFEAMDLPVELSITRDEEEENAYNVEMIGNDMGVLIGKRGQTLDALQYLTNLAVNKRLDTYVKIKLDTEDYRRRRKETLENLAKNIAGKVKRTGKDVELEPMNPYERRVIHFALQGDKYVTTHSEGEGPERHVVVTLRDDAPEYRDSRSRNRSGGYRGSKGSGNYRDSKDYTEDADAGTAGDAGEADAPTDE